VLGQAAGQITQAVEKVDTGSISDVTGFELVSQANRMIYGQVNEIAVIRKTQFDSAYLLETANTLDKLGRELTSRSVGANGHTDAAEVDAVLEKIQDVLEGLGTDKGAPVRATGEVRTTCPYCEKSVQVSVGATPGDTAAATCSQCGEVFNVHRSAAGAGFTRKRGPQAPPAEVTPPAARWMFNCPSCEKVLGAPKNGQGSRAMVCPGCFWLLRVDPGSEVVVKETKLTATKALGAFRSGSRPKALCPKCQSRINMPLRYSDGYFGYCLKDELALQVDDPTWDEIQVAG
jgi:transcription elongation factor Elf1